MQKKSQTSLVIIFALIMLAMLFLYNTFQKEIVKITSTLTFQLIACIIIGSLLLTYILIKRESIKFYEMILAISYIPIMLIKALFSVKLYTAILLPWLLVLVAYLIIYGIKGVGKGKNYSAYVIIFIITIICFYQTSSTLNIICVEKINRIYAIVALTLAFGVLGYSFLFFLGLKEAKVFKKIALIIVTSIATSIFCFYYVSLANYAYDSNEYVNVDSVVVLKQEGTQINAYIVEFNIDGQEYRSTIYSKANYDVKELDTMLIHYYEGALGLSYFLIE